MKSSQERASILKKSRRVVVKIGSSVLADPDGGLQEKAFDALARAFVRLVKQEKIELILVSSGSIACGMKKLGFKRRPRSIAELQACAASGQATLIQSYERTFAKKGLMCAQLLVTRDDLGERRRYLNIKHTINELLKHKAIPILNENDTVAVDEIKVGDNDTLAAYVASLVEADLLLLLTDCDGLHTADPRHDPKAERVSIVSDIDQKTTAMARGASWETRVGGMTTKVEAARIAGQSGIPTVIANGHNPKVAHEVLQGKDVGTLFIPSKKGMQARKHWIAFTLKAKGQLVLDKGAVDALIKRKRSLLASGLKAVKGTFKRGDPVDLVTVRGRVIARGLVVYNSVELEKILGCKSDQIEKILGYRYADEVVHRDDMVMIT